MDYDGMPSSGKADSIHTNLSTMRMLTCVLTIWLFAPAFAYCDIRIEELDPNAYEIPGPDGKPLGRLERTRFGYFRGDQLVMIREEVSNTLMQEGEARVSRSTEYVVVAKGRKIMRIAGPQKTPISVSSPWPIWIEHMGRSPGIKEVAHYNICIPEIDFYEYLEFEGDVLQALLEGSSLQGMKEAHMRSAVKNLKAQAEQGGAR